MTVVTQKTEDKLIAARSALNEAYNTAVANHESPATLDRLKSLADTLNAFCEASTYNSLELRSSVNVALARLANGTLKIDRS